MAMKVNVTRNIEVEIDNDDWTVRQKERIVEERPNPEANADITERDLQLAVLGMLNAKGLINDRLLSASTNMILKGVS